jgi:hypothetical protein
MWKVNAPSLFAWVYACLPVQRLNHISDFYETWYAHCHYANAVVFHLFVNNNNNDNNNNNNICADVRTRDVGVPRAPLILISLYVL